MIISKQKRIEKELIQVRDLAIEVTNKCNLNCDFCYANSNTKNEQLSIEKMKRAMDIVKPTGIAFTGGEPLIRHDDIVEMLPYAQKFIGDDFKGIRIETNATLSIDFNKFTLNGSSKGIHFNVSLDGFKELHESQRGIGTFNKVVDFIKEAVDRGYWITAKGTYPDEILLGEIDYLYDFAKFCVELGLPRIRMGHVKSSGRGERSDGGENYAEINAKMMENVQKISNMIEDEYDMHISDGKPYIVPAFCGQCGYNRNDLTLGVDGVLRLECQFLNVPLCHYTKYTPKLHEQGLYLMKKYNMGITNNKAFDMSGRRSVFK